MTRTYDCPGITLPQPPGAPTEGYVACYRAGHACPPSVSVTTQDEDRLLTEIRCPCCGEVRVSMSVPRSWRGVMTRSLYKQLGDAQEDAARNGTPAPCTTVGHWLEWAGDAPRATYALRCRDCPVLEQCKAYANDCAQRKLPLNGMVAGKLYNHGIVIRRPDSAAFSRMPEVKGRTIGKVYLAQVLAWLDAGSTHDQIASLAGVEPRTVAAGLDRLRQRLEASQRAQEAA